jgi:hypothetical protein
MMTVVIVAILAATVGMFFVKLLTFQEKDREEAYIRERLSDVCGAYADFLSVGSFVSTRTNRFHHASDLRVDYRQESGGVSLETGTVSRAAYLISSADDAGGAVDLDVYAFAKSNVVHKFSRSIMGDAALIPFTNEIASIEIVPLNYAVKTNTIDGFEKTDAVLCRLVVTARHEVEDDYGKKRPVTAERVVRLWNRE